MERSFYQGDTYVSSFTTVSMHYDTLTGSKL